MGTPGGPGREGWHSSNIIPIVRAVVGFTLFTAVFFPDTYQPLLDWTWSALRHWSVFRWSTFETLWSVFWYAAIEVSMTVVFLNHPEWRLARQHGSSSTERTKPRGMRRPSRRGYEALVHLIPILTLDFTMVKKFADVPLRDILQSGGYDDLEVGHSATFLIPSMHNFALHSPIQTNRALPLTAPSSRRLALELIGSLVVYDVLFFLFHLSMHVLPGLKAWHRPHHTHGEIHPQITNQLHALERLGLVLLANFSLNIIGSHVLTRTVFVPVFIWMLVEIHCGLDLPWAYDKVLPSGWSGGARKHAAHHKEGSSGLAPYFNWCDAALKIVSPGVLRRSD